MSVSSHLRLAEQFDDFWQNDRHSIGGSGSSKLVGRHVEKPWGRPFIPACFGNAAGKRIGEIWFEHPTLDELPLLVKYIFTSEKLSIQVHPSDEQARVRGLAGGKSECWYILDADPGARIGVGLRLPLSPAQFRAAALDGSIEGCLDWKPVAKDDFLFVPPGTVHAIGAGITLLEFQQNSDVTYRLYDYERPRELHLSEGLAVSNLGPFDERYYRRAGGEADTVLLDSAAFSLVRTSRADNIPNSFDRRLRWVAPLRGKAFSDDEEVSPGECLLVGPEKRLTLSQDALVLVAAPGSIR